MKKHQTTTTQTSLGKPTKSIQQIGVSLEMWFLFLSAFCQVPSPTCSHLSPYWREAFLNQLCWFMLCQPLSTRSTNHIQRIPRRCSLLKRNWHETPMMLADFCCGWFINNNLWILGKAHAEVCWEVFNTALLTSAYSVTACSLGSWAQNPTGIPASSSMVSSI